MRKEAITPLLVLLMLIAAGGYMVLNNDGNDPNTPPGEDGNNQISDEWDVYYVDSGDDLPLCNSDTKGRLYYVELDAGFQTCTSAGWAFVDLTGPAGTAGTNGTQGPTGANGADGADGVNGTNGADGDKGDVGEDGIDGMTALAVTTTESAGANCADGGLKIEVGVDDNGDGTLNSNSNEIDHTQYVCNGAGGQNGQNGADGANGSASPNTMLTSVSSPHYKHAHLVVESLLKD
jgi:hypothetical protein